jgi:hypothetical protein
LDKGDQSPRRKKEKRPKKKKKKKKRPLEKKEKEKKSPEKKEKNARLCGNCFERGVTCSCHFCGDARAKGRVRGDTRNGDFFIRRAIDRVLVDGE